MRASVSARCWRKPPRIMLTRPSSSTSATAPTATTTKTSLKVVHQSLPRRTSGSDPCPLTRRTFDVFTADPGSRCRVGCTVCSYRSGRWRPATPGQRKAGRRATTASCTGPTASIPKRLRGGRDRRGAPRHALHRRQ